jgi:hypothetical protein
MIDTREHPGCGNFGRVAAPFWCAGRPVVTSLEIAARRAAKDDGRAFEAGGSVRAAGDPLTTGAGHGLARHLPLGG